MTEFSQGILELTFTLCEQLIIFYFICNFLKHDFKSARGKLVYLCGSVFGAALVAFLNTFTTVEWWLSIVYIAYWFLYSLFFIEGKVLSKLLAAVISDVVIIGTSNLVSGMASIAIKTDIEALYAQTSLLRILLILFCQIINFFFFSLILKFADKTILQMNKREWALIISVFLITILSLGLIHIVLSGNSLTDASSVILMLVEIGLVLLNIICLYITISLNRSNRIAEELKLKEQQHQHNIQYAEAVRGQYEEIRSIRHDMKQHLTAVNALQLAGKYESAQKYISNISEQIEKIEMLMDVGSDFVNAILNSKLSLAKSKGIEVLCNSSSDVSGISEYDLCSLIGNMLDNAIEAAEKIPGSAVVEVSILSDRYKLMITVSNSIPRTVLGENSGLATTKSDPGLHGFGVKSIKAIAEKYNGSVDYYEEDMMLFCRVILGKS